MCLSIHPHVVVRAVHSHRLFTHRGLVTIAGGLVVVREWDNTCADAQNHTWVDFAVRVCY